MRGDAASPRLFAAIAVLAMGSLLSPDAGGYRRAEAAEIVQQGPEARCALKLTGPIREGDAARFGQALEPLARNAVVNLCLSSPGGVVQEAVGIIGHIRSWPKTIRTIVEEGSACYSACALVFMSGHDASPERRPERRLHVNATLGFHAPSVRKGSGDYDVEVMRQAHLQALRGMSQVLGATDEQSIPMDLFARMLVARPTEFLLVETVEQAGRWKIDLLGDAPSVPSRRGLRQACVNELSWQSGLQAEDDGRESRAAIAFDRNNRYRATFPGFGDEASFTCVVDVLKAKDGALHLNVTFAGDAAELRAVNPARFEEQVRALVDPLRRAGQPLWHVQPPETRLKDLAAPRGRD